MNLIVTPLLAVAALCCAPPASAQIHLNLSSDHPADTLVLLPNGKGKNASKAKKHFLGPKDVIDGNRKALKACKDHKKLVIWKKDRTTFKGDNDVTFDDRCIIIIDNSDDGTQ